MRLLRFRVSLRTFLVATTIVAAVLGITIRRYAVERSAEERLVQSGLSLSFYPWGSSGHTWAYGQDHEREESLNTLSGRFKWTFLRHARLVRGQRSAQLMDKPSDIGDQSLVPLRDLRHVEILQLGFQPITDDGIAHFSHLRSLKDLNMCGTRITDEGLKGIGQLTSLEYLGLEFTAVTDKGLAHLTTLNRLRDISLMGAKVYGPGLATLAQLDELESIGITHMPIRSEDLRWLIGLRHLKTLFLSRTAIDDSAGVYVAQHARIRDALGRRHRHRRRLHFAYRCITETSGSQHRGHERVESLDERHMRVSDPREFLRLVDWIG